MRPELKTLHDFLVSLYGDQSALPPDQRRFWYESNRDALYEQISASGTRVIVETIVRDHTEPPTYVSRAVYQPLDVLIPDAELRACANVYFMEQNALPTNLLVYASSNGRLLFRRDYEARPEPEDQIGSYVITRGWIQQELTDLPAVIEEILTGCQAKDD
jgi:hypothetical protein